MLITWRGTNARRRSWLLGTIVGAFVALGGCGADQSTPGEGAGQAARIAEQAVVSLSLTAANTDNTEKTTRCPPGGCNLIDLQGDWLTWQGEPSGITYIEPPTSQPVIPIGLLIPAPDIAGGQDMLIGVRRMDTPLTARTAYVLTAEVAAPESGVAVLIFPFSTTGELVPLRNADGTVLDRNRASPGVPLEFEVADAVAGYWIQVQNGWRATEEVVALPRLDTSGPALQGNLIDWVGEPWLTWTGEPGPASYVAPAQILLLQPPADGESQTIAVQRYAYALPAETAYELSVTTSLEPPTGALLLFLFDENDTIIPFMDNAGQSAPWLAVQANGESKRFVAPAGVASWAVQIQSDWMATERSILLPSLYVVP